MSLPYPTRQLAQLRALYAVLLSNADRFAEFVGLLERYEVSADELSDEPADARRTRARINARIAEWLDGKFDELSPAETLLWQAAVRGLVAPGAGGTVT